MTIETNSLSGIDRALARPHDPAHYLRMLGAIVLGAGAALFLAWFMQYLISSSDLSLEDASRVQMLDFVRVKRDENIERKDRKPPKPKLEETPEVPPMQQNADASGQQLAVTMMPADSGVDITQGGIGFGAGEGDYLPIVKVAPIYPRRALMSGIFGDCLVIYTVTTVGSVKDVKVDKERCTDAVFYRPSIEAAQRFKYKPRVIDGVAIEVEGVMNRFYYREEAPGQQ
ncbi:MAG: TonB family protein [Halioglobus sp.]